MALMKAEKGKIPQGAIILSEEEALEFQYREIRSWKPEWEMWPLSYGSIALAGTTGLSTLFLTNSFRKVVHLKFAVGVSIALPIIVGSGFGILILQEELTTKDILLTKTPCYPCVQGRAALIQTSMATGFSTLLSTFACALTAYRFDTTYVPPINTETAKFMKFCQELIQKRAGLIGRLFALNVLLTSALVHFQQQSVLKLQNQPENVLELS